MKVFRIGTSEVRLIEEALEVLEDINSNALKNEMDSKEKEIVNYNISHMRTTRKLLSDRSLQELCERCLSYFWDRLNAEGIDNPDVEWLAEDMGLTEEELIELFNEAGFKEK